MTDSVSHSTASPDPRGPAAAALQQAKAPLSDMFANLLDKTAFAASFDTSSELGLVRAAERDLDRRAADSDADSEPAPAETEAADDTAAQAQESDEHDRRDDATEDGQVDEPAQDGETPAAQQTDANASDEALLALGEHAGNDEARGLSVQPNAASGVELRDMSGGPAAGESRVIVTGADGRATQKAANAAQAAANDVTAQAQAALKKSDAAAANATATAASAASGEAAAAENAPSKAAQSNSGPAAGASTDGAEGEADGLAAALEKHTALIRAGAERAAELHQMKLRLEAHREAIKKAMTQGQNGANTTQQQNPASNGVKPTNDLTTPALPPAPAAPNDGAARPASPFAAGTAGSPAGQSGPGSLSFLPAADAASTGLEQASAASDRQAAMALAQRGAATRPAAGQPVYQPAEQVKVQIQQFVQSGADRMQIKLSPASLGRVEVTLELSPDKTVHAVVYADKPETLDMLERDARVLQQAFEEAGMKFDSDGLTFRHGQSGNPELAERSASNSAAAPGDGDEPEGGETATDEGPRRRQHDGMLDLEI